MCKSGQNGACELIFMKLIDVLSGHLNLEEEEEEDGEDNYEREEKEK